MPIDGRHRQLLEQLMKDAARIEVVAGEMIESLNEMLVVDPQYQRPLDEEKLAWYSELDRPETHEHRDMDEERRAYWRAKEVQP